MTRQTVRLTAAQAVVTYLSRQYSVADGQRRRLIPAATAASARDGAWHKVAPVPGATFGHT